MVYVPAGGLFTWMAWPSAPMPLAALTSRPSGPYTDRSKPSSGEWCVSRTDTRNGTPASAVNVNSSHVTAHTAGTGLLTRGSGVGLVTAPWKVRSGVAGARWPIGVGGVGDGGVTGEPSGGSRSAMAGAALTTSTSAVRPATISLNGRVEPAHSPQLRIRSRVQTR